MRRMTTLLACAVSFSLLAAPPALADASRERRPDLVVTNARIWTGDPSAPGADTLIVHGGALEFVGARADAPPGALAVASATIDARGARIVPGLIDAHVHLGNAAEDLRRINLRDARSREDLLRTLSDASRDLPPDAWVHGSRWSSESWPDQRHPTAEEIGVAVGGRKAALIRMDGHMLLASRAALTAAGITKAGPADPPGGKIGRTGEGEPDGGVYEEAMALIERAVPRSIDAATSRALLLRAIRDANSSGLTQVGAIESRSTLEALAAIDREGLLTLRVRATIWDGGATNVDEWRSTLVWAAAHRELSPNVFIVGFKAYMDGSLGSRTGWQSAPYLDDPHDPGNAGMPLAMAGSGTLRDLIALGASMGLQPAVHAIGDRANHQLLDWYESALTAEQRAALRPRIEHAQHLLPGDIARFGALGVVPSMQPYHKADDGRYAEQRLGAERCKTSYAFRALLDARARLAFGSDWPVVSENPMLGVAAAVDARTLDGKVFVPEQSITPEEAIRCYTANAAWALHNEATTGELRTGMAADFVILESDPLAPGAKDLGAVRVRATILNGVVVFDAAAQAAPNAPPPGAAPR